MNLAIEEWLQTHKKGDGWEPIGGAYAKGLPVVVLENENDPYPYSVQYAGNGKYFKTMKAAQAYIHKRWPEIVLEIAPLVTITAAELAQMDLKGTSAGELADRLDQCTSVVTNDGAWKYDRVPSALVMDLLDYLRNAEREENYD